MKPLIRYKMEVFSNGDAQEQIINLVSRFNDRKCEFTLEELSTFLKVRGFLYPLTTNAIMLVEGDSAIIHDGDASKPFMMITREEVYELVES